MYNELYINRVIFDEKNARDIIIESIDTLSNDVTCRCSDYTFDDNGECTTSEWYNQHFTVKEIMNMIMREGKY